MPKPDVVTPTQDLGTAVSEAELALYEAQKKLERVQELAGKATMVAVASRFGMWATAVESVFFRVRNLRQARGVERSVSGVL